MIVWKKRFFAQITVLLMILSLLSPATTSFAQGDIARPTLHSFTVSAKEATVGDKVKISADVTNDVTGVKNVNVHYTHGSNSSGKEIPLNYNSTTRKYEGTFNVGQYDAEGRWRINSIRVNDNQGNNYNYKNADYNHYKEGDNHEFRDLNNYNINVYGTNLARPKLHSFTVSAKKATVGDKVKISADVTNDVTGVKNVSVRYANTSYSGSKEISLNYNSTTRKYEGTFNVEKSDSDGYWKVGIISVNDNQDNNYLFHNKGYNEINKEYPIEFRDLNNFTIKVYGTSLDVTPPTINSFTVSAKEAKGGDKVKISADVTDDLTGIKSVGLYYNYPNHIFGKGSGKSILLNYNSTSKKYEGTFNVSQEDAEGEWEISTIVATDNQGNSYNKLHYIFDKDDDIKDSTGIHKYKGYTIEYRDLSNYNITIGYSDKNSPVTKLEIQSPSPMVNGWYSSEVYVSVNATDDKSGVFKTLYSINNGSWDNKIYAFELQNEGINTIEYKSVDNHGNEEELKSEVVKIDKTAPVTAASGVPTNKTNKDVSITLSASDKHSGVAKTEYRMNDGEWTEYTEPINSFAVGKNRVDYRSSDNTGNVEVFKSFEVNMDKTAPVTTPDEEDDQDIDLDDKDSEIEKEETENDQNSSDGNKQVDSDKNTQQPVKVMEKKELPATATSVHNLLLLGFIILGFGGAILYIGKKNRVNHL
jgi:LPXTG-motif cell wall-anchored protein